MLLTTAEGDSRVDPLHARKMAAAAAGRRRPATTTTRSCCTRRAAPVTASGQAGCSKQADELADVLVVLHLAAGRRGRDVTRLAELVVSAEPQAWRDAGFAVDDDGVSQVGLVRLRLDPAAGRWRAAVVGTRRARPTPG